MRDRLIFYLIFFLLPTSTILGQSEEPDPLEWAPIGAKWWYTYSGFMQGNYLMTLESVRDTVVTGLSGRILEVNEFFPEGYNKDSSDIITYLEGTDFGESRIIIRQEGDSIFYLRKGRFELLYDFSLREGDTMTVAEPRQTPPNSESHDTLLYIRIDSISTISIDGQELRVQNRKLYSPPELFGSSFIVGNRVIEKIGDTRFFLPINDLYCDARCPYELRCYQDEFLFYKAVDFSCDTITLFDTVSSYIQSPKTESWTIFPNPVSSGRLHLQVKDVRVDHWILRDIHGRLLYHHESVSGSQSLDIPLRLYPGMYILELRSGRERALKKLMVK